ncbi:hypothetical protein VCSRO12_1171 [Vibrio cholerae]|uniref:hypothetical protein n=1 Tax=Vibrio cholerae TaxID=666 RepID=UPI0011D9839D|nr:hypothetical protein [Vibrio cholerae]EJL6681037.1 hypothetical protein [Vibrio cholerae]MDH7613259.1 hypothetical protein [Vibrio cholerae]MDV2346698.1 hypothetical protein [Vibrio cholerae]NOF46447.1 hypothetical protein [Vibrio cholerae]NOF54837.1 hypothetical protein [Vibrio cholerae]
MNIKFSRITLALMASVSFSSLANNVISGSEVIADADIIVNADSLVSVTITPIDGLTVEDINKGAQTKVATLGLTSSNSASNYAVRMVNPNPEYPYCTVAVGTNNSNNSAEFCLGGDSDFNFIYNGNTYYNVSSGTGYLRAGNDNRAKYKVGPDTYKVRMELVKYTL